MSANYERTTNSPSPLFVSEALPHSTPIKMEDETARFRAFSHAPQSSQRLQARATPPDTPRPRHIRTEEQQQVIALIKTGVNAFVTGAAGSGKSFIIQEVAQELRAMSKCVRIVAPTGLAASHIDGSTLHSYCSWIPRDNQKSIARLENKAEFGFAQARFDDTDTLIIDEISMVSNYMLERLNRIMKAARDNQDAPFGGVQIVVLGDFCQLPPVKPFETCFFCGIFMQRKYRNRDIIWTCPSCREEQFEYNQWAFRAAAWNEAGFSNCHLTETHRQTDPRFKSVLKRMRLTGMLPQADIDLLVRHPSETEGAIRLYPRRDDVAAYNDEEFKKLPGPIVRYKCLDYFRPSAAHPQYNDRGARQADGILEVLGDQHPYERWVKLKVGTPVLLLTNLDVQGGLVNGSQGVIEEFEDYDEATLRRSRSGIDRSTPPPSNNHDQQQDDEQEPARYVSFRTGEHANLRHEQISEFIQQASAASRKWPKVRFANGRTMTIFADCRIDQLGNEAPYVLEGRTQIPLMPVWAMTLHKAQGTTLDRVVVNLSRKFGPAQPYVALSRAKTLQGLKVEKLGQCGRSDVDQTVREFLESTHLDLGRLER